jgi:hypothetical protein
LPSAQVVSGLAQVLRPWALVQEPRRSVRPLRPYTAPRTLFGSRHGLACLPCQLSIRPRTPWPFSGKTTSRFAMVQQLAAAPEEQQRLGLSLPCIARHKPVALRRGPSFRPYRPAILPCRLSRFLNLRSLPVLVQEPQPVSQQARRPWALPHPCIVQYKLFASRPATACRPYRPAILPCSLSRSSQRRLVHMKMLNTTAVAISRLF